MIYLRKNIKGYYLTVTERIDEQYWEGLIGSTYEDFLAGKWIPLSEEQVAFRDAHPGASVKQIIEMYIPVHQRTIEEAKQEKLAQIDEYDNSKNVNSFKVNGELTAWFTPAERSNYKNSIEAAELVGITDLTLFLGNQSFTISVQSAKIMLAQIQLYADQCYINTMTHKANVEVLQTLEEIDSYEFRTGYPAKLNFSI